MIRLTFVILILLPFLGFTQNKEESKLAYRYVFGLGLHEGGSETGIGILGSFGIIKSIGKKNKSRLNSNLTLGRFNSLFITDIPSQKYSYFTLDFNYHFDLLRYKAFSIFTSAGGHLSLTAGAVDDFYNKEGIFYPAYQFVHPYLMASVSGGLRFAPKTSQIAFEICPFHFQLGTSYSYLGKVSIRLDYKINRK